MRAPELRQALLAVVLASGPSCSAPQGPEPKGSEAQPVAPPPHAEASTTPPALSSPPAASLAAPVVSAPPSASAPAAALDHAGPGDQTSWTAGLVGEDRKKLNACPAGKAISTGCHVPEAIADRRAQASQPASACPRSGAVGSIPCGGCSPLFRKAAEGPLLKATSEATRATTPAACCYAACVPLPPPMPPNAGRPLLVARRPRSARLTRRGW